ncbi:GIY-YIG nuclease family protein [Trichocoleus sp. FACHB-69]|uniref:GIY-YIG nuclease family protein n=2 Tax=Cyanophyceae TaxID=3028117 RepID=UPI001A7E73E4|nr:GIY-YIG nuclease family protein [Trichocoleus sp. FACHB-69]
MNPAMIDPLALPSLPLLEHRHLPKYPAIYFALKGNKVLSLLCHFREIRRVYVVSAHEKSRFHPSLTEKRYIGRANNLYRRWLAHHRWNQFQSLIITENIQIAWLECDDTNLLPEIEKALIKYF